MGFLAALGTGLGSGLASSLFGGGSKKKRIKPSEMAPQSQPAGFMARFYLPMLMEAMGRKEATYQAGLGPLKQLLEFYQQGGGYQQGQRYNMLAAARQGAAGAGMYGSTRPMALSSGITRELEDVRTNRYGEAAAALASYLGQYSPIYPSPETIADLAAAAQDKAFTAPGAQMLELAERQTKWGGRFYGPKGIAPGETSYGIPSSLTPSFMNYSRGQMSPYSGVYPY